MGKSNYDWYGFVANVIYGYGKKKNEDQKMTKVDNAKIRAVEKAIEETDEMIDGTMRLKIIKAVYWDKTHTLGGAAMMQNVSFETAKRIKKDFFLRVAKNFRCDSLI